VLKARGKFGNRDMILFGLDDENERRMRQKNDPILVSLRSLGKDLPDVDLLFFRAATHADMKAVLVRAMTSDTKEHWVEE
jgi:hypothetical protein